MEGNVEYEYQLKSRLHCCYFSIVNEVKRAWDYCSAISQSVSLSINRYVSDSVNTDTSHNRFCVTMFENTGM